MKNLIPLLYSTHLMAIALIICVSSAVAWYWARRVHLLIFHPEEFNKAVADDVVHCRHLLGKLPATLATRRDL
jgi:hypothetical protein